MLTLGLIDCDKKIWRGWLICTEQWTNLCLQAGKKVANEQLVVT